MPSFITTNPPSTNQLETLTINPDSSIGIEEIRLIQTFLSRRPQNSDRSTVIINSAHLLTLPAQNAILKILEEPPKYADIYLVTDRPDILIPTILSRTFSSPQPTRNVPPDPDIQSVIGKFLSSNTPGAKLKLLEAFTTRDQLNSFLDQLEIYLHQNLSQKLVTNYWPTIIEARKFLSSNCNLKLVINYLCNTHTNQSESSIS